MESINDIDTVSTEIIRVKTENLKSFDIKTIQPDKLVDIESVELDKNLPAEKRISEFIRQIKNPYFFRCGKFIVQIEYSDKNKSINDCLKEFIDSEIK